MDDAEHFQLILVAHDRSELIDGHIHLKIDQLCQHRYEPLYDFFVICLDDPDSSWREKSLAKLHFFKSKIDDTTVAKVRTIALTDVDRSVRVRACGTLGIISQWPDSALREIIERETEFFILAAATSSILLLRGIPPYIALEQFNKISTKQLQPSLDYIEKTIRDNRLD